ncbi:WD-40 repeat-containing protein [Phanerochaete sordida]|uniref:methylated diphthine methylhydrolase n=1 Tax=Phanerochaete sordida TaxID=48140 RepID=A0A9P3G113_9APHY|nr:WD-40 repeat-containing protein [Phanerochaete sordida]
MSVPPSVTFDTLWPADSTEFCPHPDAANLFVCGTYKLEQNETDAPADEAEGAPRKPQVRRGKCMLFAVDEKNDLSEIDHVSLPAVLDMKWCHRTLDVPPLLGIADSEGGLSLCELDIEQKTLQSLERVECATSDVLCLSLDWSNRRDPTSTLGNVVVSLSNGSLALLKPTDNARLSVTETWHAHDHEPWIAAWNYWDTNVIYSGGDDLTMKGWDIRQGFGASTFANRRFDAGVTTIQSHPHVERLIAVGSYNDTVRLFDTRKPLVPLAETNVGGGAWRVKWHPSPTRKDDLLVACMHDGCKVVRFALGGGGAEFHSAASEGAVVHRFDEHASMAYGADWCYAPVTGDSLVASCSFYDHKLCLWQG